MLYDTGPNLVELGRGPNSAVSRPIEIVPNSVDCGPSLAASGLVSVEVGPNLVEIKPTWAESGLKLGRLRSECGLGIGRVWTKWGGPALVDIGPKLVEFGPTSVDSGPSSAESAPTWVEVAGTRAKLLDYGSKAWSMSSSYQTWPVGCQTMDAIGPNVPVSGPNLLMLATQTQRAQIGSGANSADLGSESVLVR